MAVNDLINLVAESGGECFYCGDQLREDTWHIEHIVPKSLGGTNRKSNLCLSCQTCNLRKGSKEPHHWLGLDEDEYAHMERISRYLDMEKVSAYDWIHTSREYDLDEFRAPDGCGEEAL